MKALCIDARNTLLIAEGRVYEVQEGKSGPRFYDVPEAMSPHGYCGFFKTRFLPLPPLGELDDVKRDEEITA